jgi:hypothetical protein
MDNDAKYLKRKVKAGPLDVHPTEKALVVNYELVIHLMLLNILTITFLTWITGIKTITIINTLFKMIYFPLNFYLTRQSLEKLRRLFALVSFQF